MDSSIYTRPLVNKILSELVYPNRYIRECTFFYSEFYSENIRKEKYHSVFSEVVFNPKFYLADCVQKMDEELESRISSLGNNPLAVALIINNLKDDYEKNKELFLRENILKEVEDYNRGEMEYPINPEIDDPIFLIDISLFDKYYESIIHDFNVYESVVLKYISISENASKPQSLIHRTIGELLENYRSELHLEKNSHLGLKSFNLKINTVNNMRNLTEVMNDLVDKGFLNKDETNISSFKSIFSGESIKKRINWTGTVAELTCFIKFLEPKIIPPKPGLWEVAANCFTIRNISYSGRSIGKGKLKEIKPENKVKILENISKMILD